MEQGQILSLKKRIEDTASNPTEWGDLAAEVLAQWNKLPAMLKDTFILRIEDPGTVIASSLVRDILLLAKRIKDARLFKAAFKDGIRSRSGV